MNKNKVPNIITGKDLDYLSDIFTWNYGAYKKTCNNQNMLKDEEIISLFSNAAAIFKDNMTNVLNILEKGGQNE